jgi:chromosome segregation ATPase
MPSFNMAGRRLMKKIIPITLALLAIGGQPVEAAKENASAKAVKKLQLMVQEANAEKERLTAENAKLQTDLDALKKQAEQEGKAKTVLEAKEKKLNGEISTQTQLVGEYRSRLDQATARIHEVIEKYNGLNQSKNDLATEHEQLKNTQQFTASELKRCETNNIKMYEGAKKMIGGYEKCQRKDVIDTIIDSEPFTGLQNVEFETLAQEYEDKLRKQKFQKTVTPQAIETKPAESSQESK